MILCRVMIGIGEQVYSILLLTFFFLEVNGVLLCKSSFGYGNRCDNLMGCTKQVYVVNVIPYIGKILNFLLLSWMYAYYCYE